MGYLHETPVQICRALLRESPLSPKGASPPRPISLGHATPPLPACSRLPPGELGHSALKLSPHLPQLLPLSLKLSLVRVWNAAAASASEAF